MIWFMVAAALDASAAVASDPGEGGVKLHIEAVGEVAPDMAIVVHELTEMAPDRASVETALVQEQAEIARQLKAAGIADADIGFAKPEVTSPAATPAPPIVVVPPMVSGQVSRSPSPDPKYAPAPNYFGSMQVTVTVRNLPRLATVKGILGISSREPQGTHFGVADPAAAHRLAIDRAIVNARHDAETYAAAVHMKLGPIERISNAKPGSSFADFFQTMARLESFNNVGRGAPGTETAAVAVDYVLVR